MLLTTSPKIFAPRPRASPLPKHQIKSMTTPAETSIRQPHPAHAHIQNSQATDLYLQYKIKIQSADFF